MMPVREQDPLERLNRHLDDLTDVNEDGARGEMGSPETDLIRTFTHMRRLDAHQPTDDDLAQRIWKDLVDNATPPRVRPLPLAGGEIRSAANGRAAPQPWRALLPGPQSRPGRGASLLAQAAMVLLAAVTVLAVVVAVGPNRLPVSFSLQAPTPAADDSGTRLFATTVDPDRDAGPLEVAFWRGSIAAEVQVSSPSDWELYPGTEVELVLSGTLILQADAPLRVHRAASSPEDMEIVPAGEPVRLTQGDAATIPFTSTRTYRNASDQPVELLGVLVFSTDQPVIETMSSAEGVLIRNGNLVGFIGADAAPHGPLDVAISQLAGAENAWPAQAIRRDGVVEWRLLESLGGATSEEGGTVYVLTVASARRLQS